MKQGDLVVRQSYGGDVLFRIEMITADRAILKGLDYRLLADANLSDLVPINNPAASSVAHMIRHKVNQSLRQLQVIYSSAAPDVKTKIVQRPQLDPKYFEFPGKVLHLDG